MASEPAKTGTPAAPPGVASVMPPELLTSIKHAETETGQQVESFLFLGRKSTGKKTLGLSIPGDKKFIYCFDHNAAAGLAGIKGVDYKEFLPRNLKLAFRPTPSGDDKARKGWATVTNPPGPFSEFEHFFQLAQDSGFHQQFDAVGFISCTSLQDILLDHITAMQGRPGYIPEMNDRNLAGQGIANVFRSVLSENVTIFATAHYSYEQDEGTKAMMNLPVLIGQQKSRIPNIFSNVWACEVEEQKELPPKYFVRTVENKNTWNLGKSRRFSWLPGRVEVTIKDMNDLRNEGIAALFKEAERRIKGMAAG